MSSDKVELATHLNEKHVAWLRQVASDYALDDEHKVLRVLIDYAMSEGDLHEIFTPMRCLHC